MSKISINPSMCLIAGVLTTSLAIPISTNAQSVVLEEVIVTAQKREQSLQEVPIAVTAFSRTHLEEVGITSIDGISKSVPNLVITPALGGTVNAAINIRGNGQRSRNLSRDNTVGLYLDGVPISKASGAIFDAVDLERVEVLRGPQGSLYGKNTIGGAINLITQKPSGEFGADLKVGFGNESLREFRATVDTNSIGEIGKGLGQLSARISGFSRDRDGFYENTFESSSEDYDILDQVGGRIALKLDVTDSLTAEYAYDTFKSDGTPAFLPLNVSGLPASQNVRPDSVANDSALRSDLDVSGHSLAFTYEMPGTALGDLTFKSITATREFESDLRTDFDGSGADLVGFGNVNDFEQTSQEFQVIGSTDNLNWVAGIFYFEDEWSIDNPRFILKALLGGPPDIDQRSSDEESVAVFGQITWSPPAFNDKLDLTFGIRSTKEDKRVYRRRVDLRTFGSDPCSGRGGVYIRGTDGCPILDMAGNAQQIVAEDSWTETTPMFVAGWKFNENLNAYGKIVTGFRSGGFNASTASEAAFRSPFEPETMTTFELGIKGRFANDRVEVNAAYFKNDFKNAQIASFDPVALGQNITNAGEADVDGVEIEIKAKPTDHLEMGLNLAWINADYDVFLDNDADGVLRNVANEREFPYTPEQSGSAMIKYTFNKTSLGRLSARVDYSWTDDQFFDITPNPSIDIESYQLLDARITLDEVPIGNGSGKISLWGKNLNDEEYWLAGLNTSSLQRFIGAPSVVQWADPKSYGVDFSYKF